MSSYAVELKRKLELLVEEMSASLEKFVRKPGKDFTRNRDLDFKTMLTLLISMGGNSIGKELMEFFQYDAERLVTTSAFIQQRNKILPSALEWLFNSFTQSVAQPKLYKGYRLLAVDGSDLHLPTNPDEKDCYFQNTTEGKGYNLLHLNALYDLQNKLYLDAVLQPRRSANEHRALVALVDRAIHICMHFLHRLSNAPPPDVEALIRKHISPARPGRSDSRKIRCRSAVSFLYRVA